VVITFIAEDMQSSRKLVVGWHRRRKGCYEQNWIGEKAGGGIPDEERPWLPPPPFMTEESPSLCWVLWRLDGRSLSRRESCRLNGDWLASCEKPRKEPCLSSILTGAWGRSILWGLAGAEPPTEFARIIAPTLSSGGELDLFERLSVRELTRKLPDRVKVEVLESKVMLTPMSFSRFCFRSRQAAKAQPTAWLNLSPCDRIQSDRH
jgi:hypothetical protein